MQQTQVRVLLCDDTEDLLMMLSLEFGFHPELEVVGTAPNGRVAIDKAGELQPDVIVLDLAMPVMDGLEALPEIRRVAPSARVVILSGFQSATMETKALELGACLYLEKGTHLAQIVEAVRNVAA